MIKALMKETMLGYYWALSTLIAGVQVSLYYLHPLLFNKAQEIYTFSILLQAFNWKSTTSQTQSQVEQKTSAIVNSLEI